MLLPTSSRQGNQSTEKLNNLFRITQPFQIQCTWLYSPRVGVLDPSLAACQSLHTSYLRETLKRMKT